MSEHKEYDEATKAAVMGALLTGQSVSSVAKEYKIPKGTVSAWKQRQVDKIADRVATVATQKEQVIGDLLMDYLKAALVSLKVQAEHFGDKKWLADQDAGQLAVLHGVTVDKTIRLLEALAENEVEQR